MTTEPAFDPSRQHLMDDLKSSRFMIGESKQQWGGADVIWPHLFVWVAAAARPDSPDRYWFRFDCMGYPNDAPTGAPWDKQAGVLLAHNRRPTGGDCVGKVFRTDWKKGVALYHPFDRVAANGHKNWPQEYPGRVWNSKRTIVDLLNELHRLLYCDDYHGVKK